MKYLRSLIFFFIIFTPMKIHAQISNHVVISEIYGGGGNTGAPFQYDFVELYNPTPVTVDISGWSVQYASASGSAWYVNPLGSSVSVAAYSFFLVQLGSGGSNGDTLPTADAAGTSNIATSGGKIALVNTANPLSGTNPLDTSIVDFIGYGSSASKYEGSGPAPAGNNTTSLERKAQSSSTQTTMKVGGTDEFNGNGWDSNDNNNDIITRSGPLPQNSASTYEIPPAGNQPPVIISVNRTVFVPSVGGADTVMSVLTDDGNITDARLHVRVNGEEYDSSISLILFSESIYRGIIPADKHASNGDLIEYYVSAADDSSAYSSNMNAIQGYFVGQTPISVIKSYLPSTIKDYGARINGILNSNTNLFAGNSGYIQNVSGGLRFSCSEMPQLETGKNVIVEGTLNQYKGGFELTEPNFAFIDTNMGTSSVIPVLLPLPLTHSPSYLNEGKLVTIESLATDSSGFFLNGKNYTYQNPSPDTVIVRIESNGSANTILGKPIPDSPVDVTGILAYNSTALVLKPRNSADMGIAEGDGTGTASVSPASRIINSPSVAETLYITGNGINTLEGIMFIIPPTWIWTGNLNDIQLSGEGYTGASATISGNGSVLTPWTVTITDAAVTGGNLGTSVIKNLTTPSSSEISVFILKTRVSAGIFSDIAVFPSVTISENVFEAVASGNWSSPAIWSGHAVPGGSDNVKITIPDVIVTIDGNADCADLILNGVDTAGGHLGPVLQFASSGSPVLTVNGRLEVSGGVGGGGGSRGGRPKLTSNGNHYSLLNIKGNVSTNVSNTIDRDNAGLNMNEGTVRLLGNTSDTLRNSAGLRLANLVIGDGSLVKEVTWVSTSPATLNIRSLTIRSGSSLICGGTTYSATNAIGNSSNSGLPMLTGGISVESGANLTVNNASGGNNSASINIRDGGIINHGVLSLCSPDGSRKYSVSLGDLTADPGSSIQTIGGISPCVFSSVKVGLHDTLRLLQQISLLDSMTLYGELVETDGNCVVGTITTIRVINQGKENRCGGIGIVLNASGNSPDTTLIQRTTGMAQISGQNRSIKRFFNITPKVNSNLNASIIFSYDTSELNGQNPATLGLWKSANSGITWDHVGGIADPGNRSVMISGISSFSRWTVSDADNPLVSTGQNFYHQAGWNMVSVPLIVPDNRKGMLYPNAVSEAFRYTGFYEACDTMHNGIGYWLKFPGNESLLITGTEFLSDTVDVVAGWNLIGSISRPVPCSSIKEIPPHMIESQVFGYSGAYMSVDSIFPGHAYWIKTNIPGKLVFNISGESVNGGMHTHPEELETNSLVFTDARGYQAKLFFSGVITDQNHFTQCELPPSPPDGGYDVRFRTGRYVEAVKNVSGTEKEALEIILKGGEYPIIIEWNIRERMTSSFYLMAGGGDMILLEDKGRDTLNNHTEELILYGENKPFIPEDITVSNNYPNPFNPATSFFVGIPMESDVDISIYDILGRKIRTILKGRIGEGYHSFTWDGKSDEGLAAASGSYFLKIQLGKTIKSSRILLIK